ncbi:hypothetical protein K402DRAFT_413568 [Aulographum hederae CBS 113979]|uniref:Copper acquisition factor BIM1-like domain-containing protein n=1 Tax=Aulographum hederae CBS 113979 TaxID=1176131 RepID=A0A6G1GVK9_9PEZI|nr:hypothetical protein K402DRAFT_413568 [Aulographum hederae CBS 113979]
MKLSLLAPLVALASTVSAHYTLQYPYWRGDSFTTEGASQWSWPCANVSQVNSTNNRTSWPLDGGSLRLKVGHPWAYTYVNLGLGENVTSFNVSLVDHWNQTGNGTLCLAKVGMAQLAELGVTEGTNASIQVVQVNERGNALYNCADITFSSTAAILSGDDCTNTTGVSGVALSNADGSSGGGEEGGEAASATSTGGAAMLATMAPGLLVAGAAVGFGAIYGL